ncbi:MAG: cyclic nucleotide-binding domain-containing protein [Verrucomicrobia bacterium]|nr:cyclic nucleotide-binding domain-containing protein [Verrucomicrobiota bacterium]
MKTIADLVAESAFFRELAPPYQQILAGCGRNVVFKTGAFVFREGDESREFYLLRAGKVAIEVDVPGRGAMIIQTLGEGDVLSWSWMVPPYKKRFDARAVELTRAIAFDGACIGKKCEADAKLGYEFFRRFTVVIAERLAATRLQLLDLYADRP